MSLNGTVWAPIGPSPIKNGQHGVDANGQVTAIAVHPNNSNIIYIGTGWGGVWLTRNGGATTPTWTPLFDRAPSLGVGGPAGIAIDPVDPSIIYVGTSNREGSQFSGAATQPPAGLFKSTDSGGSWVRLGSGYPSSAPSNANQFFRQVINVVIVDPANHLVVYLASNFGVFVSSDGGLNWTQGALPGGDVRSLVMDLTSPAAARILYAGVTGRGVFRSNDGGQNWTLILSGATPVVANELCPTPPCTPARSVGKFVVALAPPTSPPNAAGIQVLYATMEGRPVNRPRQPTDAPDPVGVFMSTDQGATWTLQTPTGSGIPPGFGMPVNTQGGYSFHMAVDPASPGDGVNDIIYFGAVGQAWSTDSGLTFAGLSGLHDDTHAWAFAPQPGPFSVVYSGNDGGLFKSTGGGGTTFDSLNAGGLQTALFYDLDVNSTASVTLGALQDNGIVTNALSSGVTFPAWWMGDGGDGFDVAHERATTTTTTAYGRSNANIDKSTDDGQNYGGIQPPFSTGPSSETDVYLAAVAVDPSTNGTVYASSNQNLWQSTDSGTSWPKRASIAGPAIDVDVAPTNGNNVVVAVGRRVWVSTDALGAFTLTTDITRDLPLPLRFVARVAFDPNDPTTIYAVLGGFSGFPGGHVFRTTLASTGWTDISPPLDLPFNAIALDGSETPTTLYAGTDFGVLRSVDGGANWSALDDIHYPGAPVFDLVFHQGELRAATFGRGAFSFVKPTGPAITVNLERGLDFGTVCEDGDSLTLQVFNVGGADLVITSVQRLMGSTGITVSPLPATPVIIRPGEELDFTVRFSPTTPGTPEIATIRINSNDPGAPVVDLTATGTGGVPSLEVAFPDAGQFGNVCLGSFVDRGFVLNNRGPCELQILAISSSSPDFIPPGVLFYPLVVEAGDSIELPIRFQPNQFGPAASTITIHSNDPTGPETVVVSGTAPAPRLTLVVPDNGDFGEVRLGRFTDRDLVINNRGPCPLSVTGIVSSAPIFVTPQVVSFPLTVDGGDSISVPIRFQPTHRGAATATLTIVSNDPNGPAVVNVSGTAWPPLPIAGTALEGYPLSNPLDSQHVFFIGTDKYVHELDITAGAIWDDNDLTTLAGAVPPIPTSALAGFPLSNVLSNDSKHVFFIGTDNHVYELYFTAGTGWVFNDLTSLARAVPPAATSAIDGHQLSTNSKHVFFIGTDNHVHELFIAPGGRWADNDLTTLAGAVPPTPASALTSHVLSTNSQHVFFIGTDNHVHELFIDGGSWADNDLTTLAGAVPPTPASALTSHRLSTNSQHVFFIGTDNHVHELFIDGGSWTDNDLTTLAGAVPPTPASALTSHRLSTNSQHVFFIGTDNHVHELSINGGSWTDNDLTTLAGAVPPTPASALTGYPLSTNSKHVFFIGTDNHVHELFLAPGGSWLDNDLTALT